MVVFMVNNFLKHKLKLGFIYLPQLDEEIVNCVWMVNDSPVEKLGKN